MGTERRQGQPFTTEGPWWTEEHHTHALEVHRASDTVTYLVDGEPAARFTVEQFEELMRMASTIDYLRQPDRTTQCAADSKTPSTTRSAGEPSPSSTQ